MATGRDRKALLVEDNPLFRQTLAVALEVRFPSLQLFEADDLPRARELAYRVKPDLVLMDVQLPSGSGLDLTAEIKRDHPRTLVLVCTSHDLPEYRQAALECGANGFVAKGTLSLGDLLDEIETLITETAEPSVS